MSSRSTFIKICRLAAKLALTLAVFYFIFSRLEWDHIAGLWRTMHLPWFLAGLLLFNLSQVASAWRLDAVVKSIRVFMSLDGQIRLYYLGMFYNFFFPGGIGGDGYKVYFWFREFGISRRDLLGALLYDRFSGLAALLLLVGLLLLGTPLGIMEKAWQLGSAAGLYATALLWGALHQRWLSVYRPVAGHVFLRGLLIQALQAGAILCFGCALGISASAGLVLLFLISSLAAAIPLTIGSMGARELVFFTAAPYVNIESTTGVALALLFFLATLASSLSGIYYHWFPDAITKTCHRTKP